MIFHDRFDAGRKLAPELARYAERPDVLVLGLARGGVPVAHEIARVLQAPLDVFIVRKLGVPGHDELAMGALASGGVRVLNEEVIHHLGIGAGAIEAVAAREQRELERRERLYRADRNPLDVEHRTVILVDDGLATGSTVRAGVAALRRMNPAAVVVAVPVAAAETCAALRDELDEIVCLQTPEPFLAVGTWYSDFSQTSDDEVRNLLKQVGDWRGTAGGSATTAH